MAYIEVVEVSKLIKKRKVLDNISIAFEKGKIYGVRGINGSGKTMLFRAILGIINLNKGKIILNDQLLKSDGIYPINTGILIEQPAFIGEFTAKKNLLLMSSILKKVTEDEIDKVLLTSGLDPADARKLKNYSLGMKQKLGIAQAYLGNPELLILDEPTNALDENSITSLIDHVIKLNATGVTILIASHDFTFLEAVASNIYTMENGRIMP